MTYNNLPDSYPMEAGAIQVSRLGLLSHSHNTGTINVPAISGVGSALTAGSVAIALVAGDIIDILLLVLLRQKW